MSMGLNIHKLGFGIRYTIIAAIALSTVSLAQSAPGNPTTLRPLYRVWRDNGCVSTTRANAPGLSEGFIAYTIKSNVPGTVALQLYHDPARGVARDSIATEKPPWVLQANLGHLFTTREKGTMAMTRYTNGKRWYTARENEPVKPGYAFECVLGYAYPRYGNESNDLVTCASDGITLRFNRIFGGTLWELEHDGVQYINLHDLGRQIQVSGRWTNNAVEYIFSECGMAVPKPYANYDDPKQRMGSVCVLAETNSAGEFISEAIPLEFKPDTAKKLGGGAFEPVLYRSLLLRKSVKLNFRDIPGCIQWQQSIIASQDLTQQPWYQHEIASPHLTGIFSNYYQFNVSSSTLSNASAYWSGDKQSKMIRPKKEPYRCLVFADLPHRHAFGLMGKDTANGGSADDLFGFHWKKLAPYPQDGMGVFDHNCIALFNLRHEPFVAGENRSIIYLFAGDFAMVTNAIARLYAIRDSVPWK
jgi:hypothetical protein